MCVLNINSSFSLRVLCLTELGQEVVTILVVALPYCLFCIGKALRKNYRHEIGSLIAQEIVSLRYRRVLNLAVYC